MTISESKRFLNIPVSETVPKSQYSITRVTANDFYGEFGAHQRVSGLLTVETPDIVSLRGQSRFSDKHFYSKHQINQLDIRTDEPQKPLMKTAIIWEKD